MLKVVAGKLLDAYQKYVRIFLPSTCRFYPSCSEYAKQAIHRYGFLRGTGMGAGRLLRCHPLSSRSGYDPVR